MKKIQLHAYDKEFVKKNSRWVNDGLAKFLNTIKTKHINLDMLFDDMKILSISSYTLNRDEESSLKYLHYSMKALLGHFEQASYPGQEVEVEICGEKMIVKGIESTDYKLSPVYWTVGIYMAIILRDKESILKFMNIPVQVMLDAQMADEELFMVYSFFLKSYLSNSSDTGKLLIDTYKLSSPEHFTKERYEYISHITTPQLELFISILKDDQVDFDKYLEKAILSHKEFMSDDPKAETAMISFFITAICVLAKERGLKIEIESDYIPKFLIEGKF